MKCMATITSSGRMEAWEHGMVLSCSLDPAGGQISWLGKNYLFFKIIEVHGESKSSEKKPPTLVKEEVPKTIGVLYNP